MMASFPSGVLDVCFSTRERRSAARRDSTLRPPGAGPAGPCPLNRPAGRRVPPPVACPRRAAVLRAVTEPPERGGGSRGVASASCALEPALTGRIAQRTKVRARGPGDRGSSPGRALPRRACRWASYGHCSSARARARARAPPGTPCRLAGCARQLHPCSAWASVRVSHIRTPCLRWRDNSISFLWDSSPRPPAY